MDSMNLIIFFVTLFFAILGVINIIKEYKEYKRIQRLRAIHFAELNRQLKSKQIERTRDKYSSLGCNGYLLNTLDHIKPSRKIPTNCKNCGAPLHGSKCDFCDTEYDVHM